MVSHARTGIELAQQGRRPEALSYLRYAVTSEPVNAEVWLWLAHVTPDIQEYRHCVYQALALQPNHPTALRMQSDLVYQGQGASPPVAVPPVLQNMEKRNLRQKRWRRWLIFLNVLLLAVLCGWGTSQALNRIDTDDLLGRLTEERKQLNFAVGSEDDAIAFEVTVPETWFLADEGSPSWREKRNALEQTFPDDVSLWRDIETDLGEVTFEADGSLSEPVSIVETNSEKFSPPDVPRLELVEIRNLPDDGCEGLQAIADEERSQVRQQTGFVEAEVRERTEENCLYLVHTQEENHLLEMTIPVNENRAAVWQLEIPDSLYDDYEEAIETILDTLQNA